MISGVGTDLIEIARVSKAIGREAFLKKVFTPAEQEYIHGKGALAGQSAAGIFCVKEAVLKTMQMGITDAPLRDIEVLHMESGAPAVVLHGKLAQTEGIFHVSITHSKEYASAFAVLEREV